MLYMSSQMGNDGSYSLSVTFDVGTDLNTALVMVQNRVALAMPQLPTSVQNQGITIRKRTPDILLIVSMYSKEDRYDDIFLSNFAVINIRDELLRVDGVADVIVFGQRDYSIRVWLDPQKMAAYAINASDVANAIRRENWTCPPAGSVSRPRSPDSRSTCRSTRWAGSRRPNNSARSSSRSIRASRVQRRPSRPPAAAPACPARE